MKFTTTIIGSGTKTGIQVPEDLVSALGAGRRPPVVTVPDDLAAALDADQEAKAFYATLNYSSQRRYVEPVADAKTADTRARRIAKIVTDLKAAKK